MKNKILLFLSFALIGLYSCSSDDDKGDVNFIRAKFDGIEQKFNIINVVVTPEMTDPETNYTYKDIIVTATMNSDASKIFILKSEYNITGDIIWGIYYTSDETYYENDTETSNVTDNSNGRYKGTFSGTLSSEGGGTIMITEGSFDIIY